MSEPLDKVTLPPLTIYNVRHGESITNVWRILHKWISDPAVWLTERGHGQAQQAGEFLVAHFRAMPPELRPKKIRIFRSFYRRAVQTSEHIRLAFEAAPDLGIIVEVKEHARLRELEFGYAGSSMVAKLLPFVDSLQRLLRYQGYKYLAPRFGGESPAWMEPRIRLAVDAAHRDRKENGITHFIFVSHGITARLITMVTAGHDVAWYERQRNPDNCSIRLLRGNKDEGYLFPNPNGQWDPETPLEEVESGDPKLNPGGLFPNQEEMEQLMKLQKTDPDIMGKYAKMQNRKKPFKVSTVIKRLFKQAA